MKKVFLQTFTDENCLELAKLFQEAGQEAENVSKNILDFIDKIVEKEKNGFEVFFDENIGKHEDFFQSECVGMLRHFRKIIYSCEPVEFSTSIHNYYSWNFCETATKLDNQILCKIADYQIDSEVKCLLISLIKNDSTPLYVIRDTNLKGEWITSFTHISYCCELDKFTKWLSKERYFNSEYPKHGENGEGNWEGQSRLLCSFEQAQMLLDDAFADSKSQNLYNYDTEKNHFIKFKHENRGGWYHGYHIENENDEKLQIFDCIDQETARKLRDKKNLQKKKK
jgi:hypothetical protein